MLPKYQMNCLTKNEVVSELFSILYLEVYKIGKKGKQGIHL